MTGARYITQLCFSSNLAGIVAKKIEQSFYSVYSYSGIESIEHTLRAYLSLTQGRVARLDNKGYPSAGGTFSLT